MKILALDSTAKIATVCLSIDESPIATYTLSNTMTHSETLLPMIKSVLDINGVSVREIDMFACSRGPGSFTGVRIGICTIKGLAFNSGKPCVGVSSLEALSYNVSELADDETVICSVIDARRETFFNALFIGGKRYTADRCISAEDLDKELTAIGRKVILVGDGYTLAKKLLKYNDIVDTPSFLRNQNAASVALLAKKTFDSNANADFSDLSLSPEYLRPSQAERTKEHG